MNDDLYRKAQERLMQASYRFGQAQAAMEEAETEFNAAIDALEELENKPWDGLTVQS
jgi:hypothetical protein